MLLHYKAIIVGAGVAGCIAAKTLIKCGVSNVLILEASDYAGGRVKTLETEDGHQIELGAQWVHGDIRNPLYELCSNHGLITFRGDFLDDLNADQIESQSIVIFDSPLRQVSRDLIAEGYKFYETTCERIKRDWNPETNSIEDFKSNLLTELCDQSSMSEGLKRWHVDFLRFMQDLTSSVDGIWPNDLSFKTHGEVYDDCGGKNYVFKNGVSTLFSTIFLPLIEDKIKLNSEVSRIDWSSSTVKVITTSGESYTADHVVITPSLGYMKEKHLELMKPQLPSDKCEALNGLAFGITEKIILLFDKPYIAKQSKMTPSFQGYAFVFREDDIKLLEVKIEEIIGVNDGWWKAMPFLFTVSTSAHILVTWISGQAAISMTKYSDEQVKNIILTIFNYYTGEELDKQCRLIRTNWHSNPYIRGSYSCIQNEYDPKFSSVMLEPLYHGDKPVVMFAGEAYHPTHWSAMHGAYATGLQQASLICKYLNEH